MRVEVKIYWTLWSQLEMRDNVLVYCYSSDKWPKEELRILLPACYRQEFLRQAQTGFIGGHLGERRTLNQVRQRAFWVDWAQETRLFCKLCKEYSRYRRSKALKQGHLVHMTTVEPWERLGVDVTGPHPKSSKGNIYILTLTDYFSKWSDGFPMRNQEASTIAKILVDRVFSYFGTPLQIVTDRGRNFESHLFEELCRQLGIDNVRTTAYKPSTNGLIERFHRTLNSMIAKVVQDNQRDWDTHLPSVLAAYRATIHESTGFSLNFLFLGREVAAPLDLLLGKAPCVTTEFSTNDFVANRQKIIRNAYTTVRQELKRCAERMKHRYDMRVKPSEFEIGNWVWLYLPRRYRGRSSKWQKFYGAHILLLKRRVRSTTAYRNPTDPNHLSLMLTNLNATIRDLHHDEKQWLKLLPILYFTRMF